MNIHYNYNLAPSLKKLLIILLCLFMTVSLSGCHQDAPRKNVTKICQSEKYPGNGYIVKLAKDGNTINKLSIVFDITEDIIKDSTKKGGELEGQSLNDAFSVWEQQYYTEYKNLTEGNENLSYFSANYAEDRENHEIKVRYNFVMNNKVLLKGAADPSSAFYEWLDYFSLNDVYDKEKKAFTMKKLKASYRYQNMDSMHCKTKGVKKWDE